MTYSKETSFAIIGAGVSGIFTAIALKNLGYQNITLYEKEDRITSLTHTFSYDNHQFDLSTKLIPAIGLSHDGIYPPLLQLLKQTGVGLQATPIPVFYDFAKQRKLALPTVLQQYNKIKIIKDFAKAYELLVSISAFRSFEEIHQSDIIRAGETIQEWAVRHKIEAFGSFTDYLVDLFNMGPAHQLPAAFVLVSRIHFIAPYLHTVLTMPGVRQYYKFFGTKVAGFRNFLDFKPLKTNYFVIKEGYETFFQKLIPQYDLQVTCNAQVSKVHKKQGKLSFVLNGEKEVLVDKIIFCVPPAAIADLTYLPEVNDLCRKIKRGHTIRTWVFEADNWNKMKFGDKAYVIDGMNKLGLGTKNMQVNGELMYISKETARSNLLISPVYLDDTTTETDRMAALEESLTRFDLKLKKIVAYKDFIWPHYASLDQNKSGWYKSMGHLQGKDNMYYSGECFSGIGVPTILEFTTKFTNQYFNN